MQKESVTGQDALIPILIFNEVPAALVSRIDLTKSIGGDRLARKASVPSTICTPNNLI